MPPLFQWITFGFAAFAFLGTVISLTRRYGAPFRSWVRASSEERLELRIQSVRKRIKETADIHRLRAEFIADMIRVGFLLIFLLSACAVLFVGSFANYTMGKAPLMGAHDPNITLAEIENKFRWAAAISTSGALLVSYLSYKVCGLLHQRLRNPELYREWLESKLERLLKRQLETSSEV